MFSDICITGITPLDAYPLYCSPKNCKQNIKCIKLHIPCLKPDIESINDIKASIYIDNSKVINTVLGKKVILNLSCTIKVIYTALNEEQSVHSAHWTINFCDFILDQDNMSNNCYNSNINIFIGLEDICIHNFDTRSLELSILYIICNILNCKKPCNTHNQNNFCNHKNGKKIYTPKLLKKNENKENIYYCPVEY